MEIDPRLHRDRGDDSQSAESGTHFKCPPTMASAAVDHASPDPEPEYPEPPSQRPRLSSTSTGLNTYTAYPGAYPYPAQAESTAPEADTDPNDPSADKRPRACESCRQLKVRCEPDPNPEEPCKRCAKARRPCIVTAPSRKRQKKTDSRVTELERKIDVLTATLHATNKVEAVLPSNNAARSASRQEGDIGLGRRWLVPGQNRSAERSGSMPSRGPSGLGKRDYNGEFKNSEARARDTARAISSSQGRNDSPRAENIDNSGRQLPAPWTTARKPSPSVRESGVPDIIDRGLVSLPVALGAFNRYVEDMCYHIPMVVFPPGTQMDEIRKHRPVLFHAIVAIAVGSFEPSAQGPLLLEFYKTVGDRVIVKGEKSLDLVQGLLITCAFYTPPENFEEIKFYQLAQLAVAVAMDIGMYRKSASKGKPFNLIQNLMKQAPMTDPDSPEVRRAWLGCYFVSVS